MKRKGKAEELRWEQGNSGKRAKAGNRQEKAKNKQFNIVWPLSVVGAVDYTRSSDKASPFHLWL